MQIHIAPVLLGGGTRLFTKGGTGLQALEVTRTVEGSNVTHVRYDVKR